MNSIFTKSCIKFSLKNAASEFSLIRLRMTINGIRFSYCLPVGYKIRTTYWDKETGKAIEDSKKNPILKGNAMLQVSMQNINKEIEKTTNTLIKIIESYKSRDITPSASLIQEELRKAMKNKQGEEKPTITDLVSYIDYYIDLCKQGKVLKTSGTKLTPATLATYKSTRKVLKEYASTRNKVLLLDAINFEFKNDFVTFLYENKHNKGEYRLNTVDKFLKTIVVFMRHAFENNFTNNNAALKKGFKIPREDSNAIYLTENELKTLYELKLPINEAEVRDSFLLSCYTGLRYSDISRLSTKHLNFEDNTINMVTYKTNQQVIIPMKQLVREIIEKYDNKPPKPQCNQATNRMLKKVCKQAGITDLISNTETVGGKRKECTFYKYEKVTTHTGRRSFATNAYKSGLPSIYIMKITGHKTDDSFMKNMALSTIMCKWKNYRKPSCSFFIYV